MEFGSLLSWWQWAILGIVPPAIIALYFLKLRRQPLEVPSTFLWKKSIEDLRVNSLWQRMRQSLLLVLQLAFVVMVGLALLRPYWQGNRLAGDRFIFLVDNSASMGATDVEKGSSRTRLDEAKRQTAKLIDEMKSGDSAMLISFSDKEHTRVQHNYTDSRNELKLALAAIPQTNYPTALDEALRGAAGLANPRQSGDKDSGNSTVADALPADLYIFSDGRFKDVTGFSLGNLRPIFVPLGDPGAENVGITAFSVRRNDDKRERLQAFFQVDNFTDREAITNVELYRDDDAEPMDVKQIKIPSRKGASGVFDLNDFDEGKLRLGIDFKDPFPLDNEAFAVVGVERRARVLLVTRGNSAIEKAVGTISAQRIAEIFLAKPDSLEKPEFTEMIASGGFDMIIFDRCSPKQMPLANTLFFGALPPAGWAPTGGEPPAKISVPRIIDTDHSHPLLQQVELGDVEIGESVPFTPPPGHTKLIESHKGVLAAIAPRESFEDAVLGFELVGVDDQGASYANTNWTIKLSFPLFVLNTLNYLGGHRDVKSTDQIRPGQPHELRSDVGGGSIHVTPPKGKDIAVERGKQGKFRFIGGDQPGVYTVREKDQIKERWAVNLFDREESDIRPRAKDGIKIGYNEVAATGHLEPARQETWKWLALAALVLLVGEWYIYNRRVYI